MCTRLETWNDLDHSCLIIIYVKINIRPGHNSNMLKRYIGFWKVKSARELFEISPDWEIWTHSFLLISLMPYHLCFLPCFSNRQPIPTSSTSPRGHWCLWRASSPSSASTCRLRGRGGRSGSLQRSLRWRRPPVGSQELLRERLVLRVNHCI